MKKISEKYLDKYQNLSIKELINLDNRILNTLFLEIFEQRSKNINSYDVLNKYSNNYEFFCPSQADLRIINEYNQLFLDCLPSKYEAIELSPIVPFGSNSSITNLSQKNILTTTRNSEVCSDATTALTFEACKRRSEIKKNPLDINKEVNLATIKKVLRMQRFDKEKGFLQHFGQFAVLTAGRKNNVFDYEKIKEHIKLWLDVLLKLKDNEFYIGKLNVGICDIGIIEHFINNEFVDRAVLNKNSFNDFELFKELNIELDPKITKYTDLSERQIELYKLHMIKRYIEKISKMITELENEYKDVNFYIEMDRKGGLGYYTGLCFHIYSETNGLVMPICDGGIPAWNSQILRDNKETSVVSGMGSELVLNLYSKR